MCDVRSRSCKGRRRERCDGSEMVAFGPRIFIVLPLISKIEKGGGPQHQAGIESRESSVAREGDYAVRLKNKIKKV